MTLVADGPSPHASDRNVHRVIGMACTCSVVAVVHFWIGVVVDSGERTRQVRFDD
jgi:hypothetical protein